MSYIVRQEGHLTLSVPVTQPTRAIICNYSRPAHTASSPAMTRHDVHESPSSVPHQLYLMTQSIQVKGRPFTSFLVVTSLFFFKLEAACFFAFLLVAYLACLPCQRAACVSCSRPSCCRFGMGNLMWSMSLSTKDDEMRPKENESAKGVTAQAMMERSRVEARSRHSNDNPVDYPQVEVHIQPAPEKKTGKYDPRQNRTFHSSYNHPVCHRDPSHVPSPAARRRCPLGDLWYRSDSPSSLLFNWPALRSGRPCPVVSGYVMYNV